MTLRALLQAPEAEGRAVAETASPLERAPGRTLQEHLHAGGTLDPRSFGGLVEAYRILHASGFLHGDPNMGNILIEERARRTPPSSASRTSSSGARRA